MGMVEKPGSYDRIGGEGLGGQRVGQGAPPDNPLPRGIKQGSSFAAGPVRTHYGFDPSDRPTNFATDPGLRLLIRNARMIWNHDDVASGIDSIAARMEEIDHRREFIEDLRNAIESIREKWSRMSLDSLELDARDALCEAMDWLLYSEDERLFASLIRMDYEANSRTASLDSSFRDFMSALQRRDEGRTFMNAAFQRRKRAIEKAIGRSYNMEDEQFQIELVFQQLESDSRISTDRLMVRFRQILSKFSMTIIQQRESDDHAPPSPPGSDEPGTNSIVCGSIDTEQVASGRPAPDISVVRGASFFIRPFARIATAQ